MIENNEPIDIFDLLEEENKSAKKGRKYKENSSSGEIVFGSIENIRAIVDGHSAKCFVWPDEGSFEEGNFIFNEQHNEFEPLLIDAFTASMMVQIFDCLNETNKESFVKKVAEDRGAFAALLEFTWKQVKR